MCLSVAALQVAGFIFFSNTTKQLTQADLIVVFPGDTNRVSSAFDMAAKGLADNITVINYPASQLKKFAAKHKIPPEVILIPGGKSRSTFEDALRATETIQNNTFTSIILVTSSYHMPRSLYLLKAQLSASGNKVQFQYAPVSDNRKLWSVTTLQLYYNEIVKLWGSTLELISFQATDTLLYNSPRFKQLSDLMHRYLLFRV